MNSKGTIIANELNFKDELEHEYEKYAIDLRELVKKSGTDWSSFRYVYSTRGDKIFSHTEILNVYELKKRFDTSRVFLTHTADAISPYTDYVDYIKVDKSITLDSFGKVLLCFAEFQKDWLIGQMNEQYEEARKDKIWLDKEKNYNLHLKIANKKCYIIPMKK